MELGPIKDQLRRVQKELEKCELDSPKWDILSEKQEKLRKIIQDEERNRALKKKEELERSRELELKERELEERRFDRRAKIGLGVGAVLVGLAGVFTDQYKVVCKVGLDLTEKVTKIFR